MRSVNEKPVEETDMCSYSCVCHNTVMSHAKPEECGPPDILISDFQDEYRCTACNCVWERKGCYDLDVIYCTSGGYKIKMMEPNVMAMIVGPDHEIFDPKMKQADKNRRMARNAYIADHKEECETHEQQVKQDLREMQEQLAEEKEVNKPIPNVLFPFPCPPEIRSQPENKPESKPVEHRPIDEAERQKLLRDHFAPQLDQLQEKEKEVLLKVINSNYDCFYFKGDVLPEIKGVKMDIKLMPGTPPIKQRPRPIVHAMRDQVEENIRQFIKNGAMSPIMSPWNSPLYPVWKKNGGVRLTVDYRRLNNVTIEESYPLPRCTDLLDDLGRIKPRYFSVFDMTAGFYQVPMTMNARRLAAFSTASGQYCFNRVSMGLKNSPMVFQRTMERVLRDVDPELNRIRWYIDDILVCSNTIEEHAELLEKLFRRMREVNLTCEYGKCDLAKTEVIYLGYQIGRDGMSKNSCKTKCVEAFPEPHRVKELRSFLGLCSFFRRFIKNYAARSKSLYELTRLDVKWKWGEEQQKQFGDLKEAICEDVVLAYPDFKNKNGFVIQTDGSYSGLGGMIAQQDEQGRLRPIAFASRSLKGAERNYTVSEIEMLGVVFCLAQFKQYCWGYPILIETDHSALVSLLTKPSLNARIQRWALIMSTFNPKIRYRKGSENGVADVMSRLFEGLDEDGARFSELQTACRSALLLDTRSAHPDAMLSGLLDNPQYSQIQQAKVLPGHEDIEPELIEDVLDPKNDEWVEISEMSMYDMNEKGYAIEPPIMGIDFDIESIVSAMCTFTCPSVAYAAEVFGYRGEEQEDIMMLKRNETPEFQHDVDMPEDMRGGVVIDQDVLRNRMYMMLTRNAKVARDVVTAIVRGNDNEEIATSVDESMQPAILGKRIIENEFFTGDDEFDQTIDQFEREAEDADKELLDYVAKGQQDDDAIAAMISLVLDRNSKVRFTDRSWHAFFQQHEPYLHVSSRNILYIKPADTDRYRIFVPMDVVPYLMIDTHEGMGHGSVPRMMGMLEPFVYWRHMRQSVKKHVRRCMICAARQGQGNKSRAPMTSVQVEAVKFARVYADVVKLGESRTGQKYVLTVVDNFTKWVECYPMRTQSAQETTYWMQQYLNRWDLVRSLLTDNGCNFKSATFERMLTERGVKHLYTSPYWPQGDGISERTHRTIMNMLSKHCTKSRVDWCEKLQDVVMFHNKAPNASTGQIPYCLVHGYLPNIVPGSPFMRAANMTTQATALEDPELQPMLDMFEDAIDKAACNMEAGNLLRKTYYDKAHKAKLIMKEGQRVFRMYPPARKGKIYKLARIYCGPFRLVRLRENGSALLKRVDKITLPPIRVNVGHLTHCYKEVPCNRYWNGSTLIAFKENELSGREDVEIRPEWLEGEKEEVEVEESESQLQPVT